MISSSHPELIGTLPSTKGNLSHSLRLLEHHGFVVIGRTPGGKAECLYLTEAGRQKVVHLVGSYE
jgi:hypothetical protein